MKISSSNSKFQPQAAYALMMTLFFGGISLMALAGALQWCSSTARTTERNNRYFSTVSAAEAATEKVLASLAMDYQLLGEAQVYRRMDRYRAMTPTAEEDAYWRDFTFTDAQGGIGRTYVDRLRGWSYTSLDSQYEGLSGHAATYRIISNARVNNLTPPMTAAVRQDVQVAAIPIFQFAIFYTMDLEINPNPPMIVNGRVHSNANIYTDPQGPLTFLSHVTAASNIVSGKSPLDPTSRPVNGAVTYNAKHEGAVRALTLPIGTNNTPSAVRAVVEVPPVGESPTSLVGMQRYYNKADLVIIVTNNAIIARSGSANSFATVFTNVSSFVSTNKSFWDRREGKTMNVTEINVAALSAWSAANMRATLGREVNSVYVADRRRRSTTNDNVVRLVNGQTLPADGLTISTPNPAYVQGHFNAPAADLGTTNTANTRPASIVADAITVLSQSWRDTNSTLAIGSRVAGNTTVNAAFLAGIVESNNSRYSGGVENFPRFLEDWNNRTMTYNGSMVVMFPSQYATGRWGSDSVYVPPNRNWAFDLNFMDSNKMPPGTPMIVTTIRAKWNMVAPDTIL